MGQPRPNIMFCHKRYPTFLW